MRTIVALAAGCMACSAWGQSCVPDLPGARKVESAHYVLAYRTRPAAVAIGQPFALEMAVCAKGGGAPGQLAVDAHMPEHRHGMNYRPTVKSGGAGRFQAEGFMFHMPGRWEYLFDVGDGGKAERLTDSVTLQ